MAELNLLERPFPLLESGGLLSVKIVILTKYENVLPVTYANEIRNILSFFSSHNLQQYQRVCKVPSNLNAFCLMQFFVESIDWRLLDRIRHAFDITKSYCFMYCFKCVWTFENAIVNLCFCCAFLLQIGAVGEITSLHWQRGRIGHCG